MAKNKKSDNIEPKILDVDASMQGTIAFHDPVNLRINGSFEGRLDTKGSLSVGENATVKADITGDHIIVAGRVMGNIIASQSLSLVAPAKVQGDIKTPLLTIAEGAIINGIIDMDNSQSTNQSDVLTLKEVAQYLEIETAVLEEWAQRRKIPAIFEENKWKFRKSEIDKWIQTEKIKV
ncbi:MAG: polymer-forming cytoskeletal protein [Candidatus Omnitrophica bacterium]|nr:polymer-forming cytoskeletal protein [Candidatus Omnitrophota bacterium]